MTIKTLRMAINELNAKLAFKEITMLEYEAAQMAIWLRFRTSQTKE